MPTGLEVLNEQGNVVFDSNMHTSSVIGSHVVPGLNTTFQNGTISVPASSLLGGRLFFVTSGGCAPRFTVMGPGMPEEKITITATGITYTGVRGGTVITYGRVSK